MAACSSTDLLIDSENLEGQSEGNLDILEFVMLRNWLLASDPGANVSVDFLLSEARCYACLNLVQLESIELQLLCEMSQV